MDLWISEIPTRLAHWISPLLAQAATDAPGWDWYQMIFRPEIIVFMIPIVAILVGGAISILKMWIKHRERMGLIEHGIHPDYPPEEPPHGGAPGT